MKRVLIIGTGGTIASSDSGAGLTPAHTGEELARRVPGIEALADLSFVQPLNLDSTNIGPAEWLRVKDAIGERYEEFDGFVILHGTDTMAYAAAALSYLIQDSPKPIVFTGSQLPMERPGTDARTNVRDAVAFAVSERAREVSVVFGGVAIAGTRARKQRTVSFNAMESLNYPPLARIQDGKIAWSELPDADCTANVHEGAPRTFDQLNARVMALKLTPGIDPRTLDALAPLCDALVIESFGRGGIPEHENASFKAAVDRWLAAGKALAIGTQTPEEGCDLRAYEVGRSYAEDPRILQCHDMTLESALTKLMWAIPQASDNEALQELFERPVNHDRIEP